MRASVVNQYEYVNLGQGSIRVSHYLDENRVIIESFSPAGEPLGKVQTNAAPLAATLAEICQEINENQKLRNEKENG